MEPPHREGDSDGPTLRPTARTLVRDIGSAVLIHVLGSGDQPGDAFDLSETGAMVWRTIGSGARERDVIERLGLDQAGGDRTEAIAEVRRFVDDLVDRGALERTGTVTA